MAVVIIAEKPSVASDIAKVLGVGTKEDTHWQSDEIIVTWAVGHILELKKPEEYDESSEDELLGELICGALCIAT